MLSDHAASVLYFPESFRQPSSAILRETRGVFSTVSLSMTRLKVLGQSDLAQRSLNYRPLEIIKHVGKKIRLNTRWFKYDRDKL
jgi:hypothetical protein